MPERAAAAAADDLGAQLLSTVAKLNRWATKHSVLPIPPGQARLLSLVDMHGSARVGELAAADHCSQPTMTAQVKRLEQQGLLRRTADEDDARASLISLSDEGVRVLGEARLARSQTIAPALEQLSEADRRVLRRANDLLRGFLADAPPKG